jgi:hypothetical protein
VRSPDTTLDHPAHVDRAEHDLGDHVSSPWYVRVVPVSAALLALLALAALVPGFRHEAALSLTRQTAPFVELYFAGPAARADPAACARTGRSVTVRFAVESHLDGAGPVAYRIVLDPQPVGTKPVRRDGEVQTRPGETRRVVERLRAPARGAFRIEVSLPSLDEHLAVRCAGGRT